MRFQEKIREYSKEEIWSEYCGFLDISLEEFMYIQRRLLLEQVELLAKCPLGQQIMKGQHPTTVEEFRRMVPLTTYEDYAPMLLGKHKENLPAEPVLWIQTTWEGGLHPLKVAPYTKSMLDTYKHNMMACFMLATSRCRGDFDISVTDHMLYALAPLPYATGILPLLLHDEIDIAFLPPVREAEAMSFKERNTRGFKLGLRKGIEYFFGLGSVTYYVSKSVASMHSGSSGPQGKPGAVPQGPVSAEGLYVCRYGQLVLQGRPGAAVGHPAHGDFCRHRAYLHRHGDLEPGRHVLFSRRLLL